MDRLHGQRTPLDAYSSRRRRLLSRASRLDDLNQWIVRPRSGRRSSSTVSVRGREDPNSAAGADHLNVEVADLLAQGVAVDPEQVGGADLVAARRRECGREQWLLHLAQDAVIEPGRRQAIAEAREIAREVAFH